MSQILFDFLARNENASIVLVDKIVITSVKVIIGSHVMKLKFAERPVANQFCIEKHFSGAGVSLTLQRTRDTDFLSTQDFQESLLANQERCFEIQFVLRVRFSSSFLSWHREFSAGCLLCKTTNKDPIDNPQFCRPQASHLTG